MVKTKRKQPQYKIPTKYEWRQGFVLVGVVFGEAMAFCSLIHWSIIFEGWKICYCDVRIMG